MAQQEMFVVFIALKEEVTHIKKIWYYHGSFLFVEAVLSSRDRADNEEEEKWGEIRTEMEVD